MLIRRPLTWNLLGLSAVVALTACQTPPHHGPSSANPPSAAAAPEPEAPARVQTISFRFTPDAAFRTLDVQPRYVKLTISKDSTVKYAQEADIETGFVNTQESSEITADLSDGRWSATLGLYFTPTSNAFLEFKGVFDVDSNSTPSLPIDNVVELNSSTYLMGAIADEIRKINPSLYTSMSLANLKEYTRGLLVGSETATEDNPYPKLVGKGLVPATPAALSAEEIAQEINANRISLTFNAGSFEAEPQRYRLSPSLAGTFKVRSGWPAAQLPATNGDGKMFLQQTDANTAIPSYLHGFVPDPLHPTRLAIPSSNFGTESSPGQTMAGRTLQQYPVLGTANTTGSNSIPVVYTYVKETTGGRALFKAINQSNGSVVWSHNFTMPDTTRPSLANAGQDAILAVRRDKGAQPNCDCDDIDTVFVTLNGDFFNPTTTFYDERKYVVFALRQSGANATQVWSREFKESEGYNPLATSGALSRDGSKLYLVTNKNTGSFKPFLTTLNTSTGAIINEIELNGTNGESVSHGVPTVGSDGTVYLMSKHLEVNNPPNDPIPSSRIYAFNEDGTRKWDQEVSEGFDPHILIDHQNGQDILYLLANRTSRYIKLYSYYGGSGLTPRWVTPFDLGPLPDPSTQRFADIPAPVIGQRPDGSRMLYVAYNIRLKLGGLFGEVVASKVAAVHDQNASPSLAWETYPGGVLRTGSTLDGLSLFESHLYVGTSNGGENQGAGLQAIKVNTPAMPSSAPWPKVGGNAGNQGVAHDLPTGHN
ncbi:MAG: hypothetical protein ACO1RX_05355 [Candidatus Sericytochromatia bacterium]